jgi:hypothetical protein
MSLHPKNKPAPVVKVRTANVYKTSCMFPEILKKAATFQQELRVNLGLPNKL